MNIGNIQLYKYSLPLLIPLILGDKTVMTREGFLIKITADPNLIGISEIAPLPHFSKESLNDVIKDVADFKKEYTGKPIPTDILERTKSLTPSVRFGLETALLNLHASFKKLTFVDLLNPNAKRVISVNALLTGSVDEIESKLEFLMLQGYKTFKIKVGRNKLKDEIKLIQKIQNILDDSYAVRLDANRKFEYEDGCRFLNELKGSNIEYVEEPFQSKEELQRYVNTGEGDIPIALDETLREIEPDELNKYKVCTAVVLKPALLGYANAIQFAKTALSYNMKPVISSS
ncbi:MAG: o-succinylbenzoate synthase, partial [Calditrichaeota bacterium]